MQNHHQIRPSETDQLLTVLADRNRRLVIEYLQESPRRIVALEELAGVLAERGGECEQRAHIALHHSILPALSETRAVEYDPDSRTVRYEGDEVLEGLLAGVQRASP